MIRKLVLIFAFSILSMGSQADSSQSNLPEFWENMTPQQQEAFSHGAFYTSLSYFGKTTLVIGAKLSQLTIRRLLQAGVLHYTEIEAAALMQLAVGKFWAAPVMFGGAAIGIAVFSGTAGGAAIYYFEKSRGGGPFTEYGEFVAEFYHDLIPLSRIEESISKTGEVVGSFYYDSVDAFDRYILGHNPQMKPAASNAADSSTASGSDET